MQERKAFSSQDLADIGSICHFGLCSVFYIGAACFFKRFNKLFYIDYIRLFRPPERERDIALQYP
ncbi:hypothetical protein GGR07_000795 [Bacteroides pyogenes]|nr:hypothetical protein [Bacteroides pyogenes]SUV32369.1 Uncharacterised protein [Bacteroides pyogenes]